MTTCCLLDEFFLLFQGMVYLHDSPIRCHGSLKSSNVLIDSHWICKIGDTSMPVFREGERINHGKHAQYYRKDKFSLVYKSYNLLCFVLLLFISCSSASWLRVWISMEPEKFYASVTRNFIVVVGALPVDSFLDISIQVLLIATKGNYILPYY